MNMTWGRQPERHWLRTEPRMNDIFEYSVRGQVRKKLSLQTCCAMERKTALRQAVTEG